MTDTQTETYCKIHDRHIDRDVQETEMESEDICGVGMEKEDRVNVYMEFLK